MTATAPPSWRLHRCLMIAPGIAILALAAIAYCVALSRPTLNFGKSRLLAATLFGAGVAAGGLVLHGKAVRDCARVGRHYWKTIAFTLTAVAGLPAIAVLLSDAALGVGMRFTSPVPVLVLRPNSTNSYRTREFAFTIRTNSLGFRGPELDPHHRTGTRMLALGDSFTSGWGVDDGESWPAVLEALLRHRGHEVEVLNFGCPGAGVDAYATVAKSVVPLARPDVVLVGVLQGIDLKLADLGPTTNRLYQARIDDRRRTVPGRLLPNICDLLSRLDAQRRSETSAAENRRQWQELAQGMLRHLGPDETRRFDALDKEIRQMFFAGDLNPWEVFFALKHPDYVSFALAPEQRAVQEATQAMANELRQIKHSADSFGAKMLVLSVPPAWYFARRAVEGKRRVGYRLDDSAIHNAAPDEAIRSACRQANVDCASFAERFRALDSEPPWFFEFDGMYNARGHALFAEEASRAVARLLN